MVSTRKKGKLGAKAASAMIEHPVLRHATSVATPPAARLGWGLGKRKARRRAHKQADRLGDAARTVGTTLSTYGPQAAEQIGQMAQGLGLTEAPTPKRTTPRVAVGVVIGAAAVYFLEPGPGRQRRQRIQKLVGS
ncbi:MAG: hypothetical protein ACYC91_08415 [Solirubrobacteraceae bacterium]